MDKNRVLDALHTLQSELSGANTLDDASRQSLLAITADIHRKLEADDDVPPEEGESLGGKLQDSILEFEAEHPQVTAAVNQVAAALANLGI
ncbi:DUF4404 family protein [Lacipirellula sp.]|uniref:DUF4404 family protein n=1 Tax=Lacipirellula sp. TaxID=2691419 RepID=UPI003D108EF9